MRIRVRRLGDFIESKLFKIEFLSATQSKLIQNATLKGRKQHAYVRAKMKYTKNDAEN
jgi:hypothetical protein